MQKSYILLFFIKKELYILSLSYKIIIYIYDKYKFVSFLITFKNYVKNNI